MDLNLEPKITPALWFHTDGGKMSLVLDYYRAIFEADFLSDTPMALGQTPGGYAEMCSIYWFGRAFLAMTTERLHQPFNDSFAMIIHCDHQQEIDRYWDYFTLEGQASACGWCQDQFGLRWQIIPKNMGQLMQQANAGQILMQQSKIVIADYGEIIP
jgi:predicted 3-demethylubiquinone-9 3-methyltransferase (glyoxalase superfamily)